MKIALGLIAVLGGLFGCDGQAITSDNGVDLVLTTDSDEEQALSGGRRGGGLLQAEPMEPETPTPEPADDDEDELDCDQECQDVGCTGGTNHPKGDGSGDFCVCSGC